MQNSGRTARSKPPQAEERIVYARTADDLDLRGVLIRPRGKPVQPDHLILWVHTRQQNFAEPEYVGVGRCLAGAGHNFLSVDTRGHDFGSWARGSDGPVLHGSAWERFSDCVFDLDAWVDHALGLGYRSIFLVGHGFGGAKVVYFQSQRQRPEVAAIGLASSGSAVRDKFTEEGSALAERMVAEGRGRDLMPWGTGGDTYASTVSADWFVARHKMHHEVFGNGTTPPAISRIRVPIFAWYGSLEDRPNRRVAEFVDRLRADAFAAPLFEGSVIEGLPFFYIGHEAKVAEILMGAMARIGLAPVA